MLLKLVSCARSRGLYTPVLVVLYLMGFMAFFMPMNQCLIHLRFVVTNVNTIFKTSKVVIRRKAFN